MKKVGDAVDDPDFFKSDDEEGVTSIHAKPEVTRLTDLDSASPKDGLDYCDNDDLGVKYKCLDAHDDYSTKREKDKEEGIKYQWATSDMLDSLDKLPGVDAFNGDDLDVAQDHDE